MIVFAVVFIASMIIFTILPLLTAQQYPSQQQQTAPTQNINPSDQQINITPQEPIDNQPPQEDPFQYNTGQ